MDDSFDEDADYFTDSEEECLEINLAGIGGTLLNEAQDFIVRHDDITPFNAIMINQQYIRYLEVLQKKVSSLIELCDKRYDKIEEMILNRGSGTEQKRCTRWQSTRYFGYPFFKTSAGKRAPENDDHREKLRRGELLPMDFLYMKKKNWTLLDQKNLLEGVKIGMMAFHSQRVHRAIKVLERRRKHPGRLAKMESLLKERGNVADMSFANLWNCVKDCEEFIVDWELVSMKNLKSRHMPIECEAMWRLHLCPELKTTPWTTEEEDVLLNAVEEFGENAWQEIAMKVGGRSEFQCFVHYQGNFGIIGKIEFRKKFTQEEDDNLLKLVDKYRFGDSICWTSVGSEFHTRTKHTLYKRYQYTLKPDINHDRFTAEDDCVLMAAIEEYGMNFSKIVQNVMPNRTVPQLRSRYHNSLMYVGNNNVWTQEEDEALMRYSETENKTWAEIANILHTHNRISCRTRYRTIKKFLDANPDKRVRDVPRKHRRLTTTVTRDNWKQKIVELHNKPGEPEDPFKETSAIDQKFFKLFLTSFDYNFGEELHPHRPITNNLFHLSRMLNFTVTSSQVDFVQEHLSEVQRMHLKSIAGRSLAIRPPFWRNMRLPISWSSLVAFRGIAATLALDKSPREASLVSTNVPEVLEFKRRFRKMFYWTAMLSRVPHRSTESNLIQIEEIEDVPEATSSATPQEVPDPTKYEYVVECSGEEYVIREVSPKKRASEDKETSSSKRIKTDPD